MSHVASSPSWLGGNSKAAAFEAMDVEARDASASSELVRSWGADGAEGEQEQVKCTISLRLRLTKK